MPRGKRNVKKSCLTCKFSGREYSNGSVDCENEKTADALGPIWDFGIENPGEFYCSNYSPGKKGAERGPEDSQAH